MLHCQGFLEMGNVPNVVYSNPDERRTLFHGNAEH